jgi:hypothetical protein
VDRRVPAHAGECLSRITEPGGAGLDPGPSPAVPEEYAARARACGFAPATGTVANNRGGNVDAFICSADTAKGNRPSFAAAASPEEAERLYERFCAALRELGPAVEQGVFGARMDVELVNDGPVTIVLDRP